MIRQFTNTILASAAIAAACTAGVANATALPDRAFAGDKYGCTLRADMRDVYGDGARAGRFDVFIDGTRVEASPASEHTLSGLDRSGVSADPARKFDVYTDGALAGMDRSGVSADPARKFDVYTDGAVA
ncbi:hypothetical protein VSR17_18010 [Cupriavidus taiwanensis]|uniref:hypothetical protein n=1 Tax=Cupriavidus taiwanensis TaxID=164546 RepID=UPI000E10823C|nr:hypothetical protein [Cupriavidus taiwanensis]SOY42689.1 conserved exported hypothetical protein [Cupriavidus taiwanensis]SOY45303.1 conserved exported hypothetical protein [Cupriavidus taiwanensis]SOY80696.1 conserved exported hypothetical protein [Cupriavidus taiwanensis]SOZ33059.1 conserved exported hypothetical protein [Cupriavidus taiwanensis]SOZ52480.1 conserved exported hypothetical protein [Cupriavidus taiwanensis]